MRVNTLRARGAAARAGSPRARARMCRRVDVVADHLEREIGLHARAHVEIAVMEQRPAAMRALDAAQIDARSCARARRRPARRDNGAAAHIRPEWWRRPRARTPNGRPAAGGRAAPASRPRCAARASSMPPRMSRSAIGVAARMRCRSSSVIDHGCFATRSAARLPDGSRLRWWPASPCRSSRRPGPDCASASARRAFAVLRRRRREGRAALAHDLPGRQRRRQVRSRVATSPQIVARQLLRAARRAGGRRALMVTESRPGKANSHSRRAVDHAEDRRRIRPADRCGNAR